MRVPAYFWMRKMSYFSVALSSSKVRSRVKVPEAILRKTEVLSKMLQLMSLSLARAILRSYFWWQCLWKARWVGRESQIQLLVRLLYNTSFMLPMMVSSLMNSSKKAESRCSLLEQVRMMTEGLNSLIWMQMSSFMMNLMNLDWQNSMLRSQQREERKIEWMGNTNSLLQYSISYFQDLSFVRKSLYWNCFSSSVSSECTYCLTRNQEYCWQQWQYCSPFRDSSSSVGKEMYCRYRERYLAICRLRGVSQPSRLRKVILEQLRCCSSSKTDSFSSSMVWLVFARFLSRSISKYCSLMIRQTAMRTGWITSGRRPRLGQQLMQVEPCEDSITALISSLTTVRKQQSSAHSSVSTEFFSLLLMRGSNTSWHSPTYPSRNSQPSFLSRLLRTISSYLPRILLAAVKRSCRMAQYLSQVSFCISSLKASMVLPFSTMCRCTLKLLSSSCSCLYRSMNRVNLSFMAITLAGSLRWFFRQTAATSILVMQFQTGLVRSLLRDRMGSSILRSGSMMCCGWQSSIRSLSLACLVLLAMKESIFLSNMFSRQMLLQKMNRQASFMSEQQSGFMQ